MDGIRIDRRRLLAVATAALAGMADWPVHAQARPEKNKLTVGLGAPASLGCLPLTIAERLGYFSAEGLEVDLHDFGGGLRSVRAIQDGQGDVMAGAFEHTIQLQGRNQHYRAFLQLGRAPQVAMGVANRSLPAYRGVADLRGRRIGVASLGSMSSMVASLVMLRGGVLAQDVQFVEYPHAAAAMAAVRAGQVDAICHHEPVMSMLEHKSDVRIISDTRSLKGSQELFGGPVVGPCLVAPADYLQKNPQTIQAMANAVVHALKWLQTAGPSDIIKVVPEPYLLGDRGLYLASFNKVREAIALDGLLPEEGAKTALRALTSFDPAIKAEKIDLGKTYTNEFARRAKEKYKA
jgi:NitT/TauT family transport system substrate-binding protein